MKIVYCLNSIRYLGGIQKITIIKANALAEIPGNEVYLIVTDNKDGIIQVPLSSKVNLIDLDVNYFADDWKGRWYTLKGIITKRHIHFKRLKNTLEQINPDIVISTGLSEKFILPKISGKWKLIRELHSNKNYRFDHAKNLYDKIKAYITNFYDYNITIKKYDKIIVLTNEDKELNWKESYNISVIPNPSTFTCDNVSELTNKNIISIGRLCPSKNYRSLITAFCDVVNEYPDWSLHIYGDGEEKQELNNLILNLRLEKNVFLEGHTLNIEKELTKASIFASTSLSEGFGLTLIEAMTCGLPVISYACPCGPKDIISDGVDGYLISVNDEKFLSRKLMHLIQNQQQRKAMGAAAIIKAKNYTIENIISQWMTLFSSLLEDK